MNMETMNDDVGDKLDSDASTVGYMDISTTTINGLETVHNQLLFQLYHHVSLEHNPQRLILDNRMAKSSWFGVNNVFVSWVCDNVEASITTSNCVASKTYPTVSEAFAVVMPVTVTTPTVIDRVTGSTRENPSFLLSVMLCSLLKIKT